MVSEILILSGTLVGLYNSENFNFSTTSGTLILLGIIGGVLRFYHKVNKR